MAKEDAQFLIVGNGSAALAAVEAIHRAAPKASIKVISQEDCLPYSPTALPYLFADQIKEKDLFLRDLSFYEESGAQLVAGKKVTRVKPGEKVVTLEDGQELAYEKLLIATGAVPALPRIEGLDKVCYFVFRTLQDSKNLAKAARGKKEAVVLGGGLVGMETAAGLIKKGLKVTVIEKEDRILPLYFDGEAAGLIKKIYQDKGVELITGDTAQELGQAKKRGRIALKLKSSTTLECQLLVVATGMIPNLEAATGSGLAVNVGIVVDNTMRTSNPDIYAAGDVAEARDFFSQQKVVNAILPDAVEQGQVAGTQMAGGQASYSGGIALNIFNFFGHRAFSCGQALARGANYQVIQRSRPKKDRYRRLVFEDGRLVGAILLNEGIDPGIVLYLIRNRVEMTNLLPGLEPDLLNFGRYAMIQNETPQLPKGI